MLISSMDKVHIPSTDISTQEAVEAVITDHEAVRILRTLKQYQFYGLSAGPAITLEQTFDKPAVERFLQIREALFPKEDFPYIDEVGLNPRQLTSRVIEDRKEFLPYMKVVGEDLLPSYFKLIDEIYETIKTLEDRKIREDCTFRLIAFIFTIGIVIHPAANGNGQTFKMLILSYLHELLPEFKDRYMPLKFSGRLHTDELEIRTLFTRQFKAAPIEALSFTEQQDLEIMELFHKTNAIRNRRYGFSTEDPIVWEYKKNLEIYNLFKEYATKYRLPKLLEGFKLIDWYKKLEFPGSQYLPEWLKEKISMRIGDEKAPSFAGSHALQVVEEHLVSRGHDPARVKATLDIGNYEIDRSTRALLTLLKQNNNPNLLKLRSYILGIDSNNISIDSHSQNILNIVLTEFKKVETEIKALLSNPVSSKEAIQQQFQISIRYNAIARDIDELHRNDWDLFEEVFQEMASDSSLITQEQQVDFLERKIALLKTQGKIKIK